MATIIFMRRSAPFPFAREFSIASARAALSRVARVDTFADGCLHSLGHDRSAVHRAKRKRVRMAISEGLEEVAAALSRVLPPGLGGLRRELERNFRAVLQANLEKLDLVGRERFQAQAELLEHANERLAQLERRLEALEAARRAPRPPAD
ncbi:MAG TPA: accessory factor UbiK family protein [Nevskiaceae bacterium]